ncbi:hypothetical protein AB0K35_27790 [Micromonospora sp. NPDC053740]|uniref:hypothetical protein n=1 Tax=Micromonospora sp. NPDC053740 TaxID=3155173 RepID=UPI0034495E0C
MSDGQPRAELGDRGRFDGFPGPAQDPGRGRTRLDGGQYVTDHSGPVPSTSRFVRTVGGGR